jgi:hypothetical protein
MKKASKNAKQSEPLKARKVYDGSNGGRTRSFCCALGKIGQLGMIAAELFRVQKASARAKVYSGGITGRYGNVSYQTLAYKRKGRCLSVLCKLLQADACGLTWGCSRWDRDRAIGHFLPAVRQGESGQQRTGPPQRDHHGTGPDRHRKSVGTGQNDFQAGTAGGGRSDPTQPSDVFGECRTVAAVRKMSSEAVVSGCVV